MNEIYRYNPNAKYIPKQWPGGINLSRHVIYVNQDQYVRFDFPDIFSDYEIILEKDWWSLSNKLFYQLQIESLQN